MRRAVEMLNSLLDAAGQKPVRGTSEQAVLAFESQHGMTLPDELHQWTLLCEYASAEYLQFYGLFSRHGSRSVSLLLKLSELFASALPFAGDGTGCHLCLAPAINGVRPVVFIEGGADAIGCVVASGLHRFLLSFIGARHRRDRRWPFIAKKRLLEEDPDLERMEKYAKPWDV